MAFDNSGITNCAIDGIDLPLIDEAPMRTNRYVRSTVQGASRTVGTRKESQPVMVGPLSIQLEEQVDPNLFTQWAEDGSRHSVQITLTDGRTMSGKGFYIVGDVDISPREGTITFSMESSDPAGLRASV